MARACLSGGPSAATNIPVVHILLMAKQSTFDLDPEEPRKRYENIGRVTVIFSSKNCPNWPSSYSVRAILPYAKCLVKQLKLNKSLRELLVLLWAMFSK